ASGNVVGVGRRLPVFLPGDPLDVVDLAAELLLPRRGLGEGAEVVAALLQLGQLLPLRDAVHVMTDLLIDRAHILRRVDLAVDVLVLGRPWSRHRNTSLA